MLEVSESLMIVHSTRNRDEAAGPLLISLLAPRVRATLLRPAVILSLVSVRSLYIFSSAKFLLQCLSELV